MSACCLSLGSMSGGPIHSTAGLVPAVPTCIQNDVCINLIAHQATTAPLALGHIHTCSVPFSKPSSRLSQGRNGVHDLKRCSAGPPRPPVSPPPPTPHTHTHTRTRAHHTHTHTHARARARAELSQYKQQVLWRKQMSFLIWKES